MVLAGSLYDVSASIARELHLATRQAKARLPHWDSDGLNEPKLKP